MDTFHAVQDAAEYRTNTVCLFIFAFPTSSLREKCPNTEFFLVRIFLYSVQIEENTDKKNSVLGHFLHSELKKDKTSCN